MDAAADRVTKTTHGTPLEHLTLRAYDAIGVPLLVTSLSYDVLWVASSLLERFGWREDAVVGRTLQQVLGPNQALTSLLPTAAEVIRRGRWSKCGTIDLGQPQVRHVRVSVHPVANGDGASSALAVTLEEVTEATERLTQLEALLDQVPIGIAWSDASGEYLAGMNPAYAEMQGDTRASLVGTRILDRFPEAQRALVRERLDEAIATGSTEYETERLRPDGTMVPTYARVLALDPKQGLKARFMATVQDLRRVREMEAELASERLRTALAASTAAMGFWSAPAGTEDISFTATWLRHLGYEAGDLPTGLAALEACLHPEDRDGVIEALRSFLASPHGTYQAQYRLTGKDGSVHRVVSQATVERDAEATPISVHGIDVDVTEMYALSEQVEALTFFDPLTGFPNRVGVLRNLDHLLGRQRTKDGSVDVAVCILGLDDFRTINDVYGTAVGDAALKEVPRRLADHLGTGEVVGRLADDRFAFTISSFASLEELDERLRAVHALLVPSLTVGAHRVLLSGSVGVAIAGRDGTSASSLAMRAEAALHAAKESGRARLRYYAEQLDREATARLGLRTDLMRALANDALHVEYQPQARLDDGRIVGFEALVRWTDPVRGEVSPLTFVMEAERSGVIGQLGRFVRRTALADLRSWHDAGHTQLRVAVNVSPRELLDPSWAPEVLEDLRTSGVPFDALELEITETTALTAVEHVRTSLTQLRSRGVKVAIDDFGTGYASLSQLQHVPADVLKIDVGFIRRLDDPGEQRDRELVRAMVALGGVFGLEVLAEGVETASQRAFLRGMGCTLLQGWLLGRPMPAQDVPTWCASRQES